MLNLKNYSIERIKNVALYKKVILWGAGKRTEYFLKMYRMESTVEMIIDNDKNRLGEYVADDNVIIPIRDKYALLDYVRRYGIESVLLIITPRFFDIEIMEQLDEIDQLNGLDCCLASLIDDFYEIQTFDYSKGADRIPKKIHYCWFGKKNIPDHLKRYIDGWHKMCPSYEIKCWNEDNYDIKKNKYMYEAYQVGKYGFVPDYARLDIIYQEGGIYLDTDVELLKKPDELLKDDMFCCFNCYGMVALGLGFGAVPGHPLIKKMRDVYDGKSFYKRDENGNMVEDLTACVWYQNPIIEQAGFNMNNSYQKKNGVVIYPSEVMAPTGGSGVGDNFTDKTISIHHAELSWVTQREKDSYHKKREFLLKRK